MTDKRKEELLRRALECISRLESGRRLYGCLHDSMGMANTEIEEAGYTLWEYYEEDTPEHMAAASGRQYAALEAWEWRLKTAVERTVQDGLRNTVNGNWKIPYAELKKGKRPVPLWGSLPAGNIGRYAGGTGGSPPGVNR